MSRGRHSALVALGVALGGATASGCSDPAPYAIAILPRHPDGAYRAQEAGEPLDLMLGFQGYRFVKVELATGAAGPRSLDLDFVVAIEGFADHADWQVGLPFSPQPDGTLLSEPLYFRYNHVDTIEEMDGHRSVVTLRTRNAPSTTARLEGVLVHRAGCIEQFDSQVTCP